MYTHDGSLTTHRTVTGGTVCRTVARVRRRRCAGLPRRPSVCRRGDYPISDTYHRARRSGTTSRATRKLLFNTIIH